MSHQNAPSFESKKIRYASADTPQHIYKQIRQGAEKYFTEKKLPKHATAFMACKAAVLVALIMGSYWSLTQLETFGGALAVYFLLGFASLILSINLGHDAAHHAVTGVKRTDDFIFQTIFALQGLSGYVWQIRHNYSHHVLPNVKEHDTDLEITSLILFEPNPEVARWYHRYQHIYAPFLYAFTSFHLLFVQDFKFFLEKDHANLHFERIPLIEWVKMLSFKVLYFGLTFGLPMAFGSLDFLQVVAAWAVVHMTLSVFVAFTFFISHHVKELDYVDSGAAHDLISDSWIHHQITTTIDFEPDNAFANFLFGGFNLHVAHHVFPEISHEHYPAMTRMIRQVLADNNASDWYKSFSFTEGCVSHLQHLKNIAQQAFAEEEPEKIDKYVGLVFNTPHLHHIHHHYRQPYTDTNYADVLIIWDRLFGTYARMNKEDLVYGLEICPDVDTNWQFQTSVALPFQTVIYPEDLLQEQPKEAFITEGSVLSSNMNKNLRNLKDSVNL